jgi:hypothetical protein
LDDKPKLAVDDLTTDFVNDPATPADHDAVTDHEWILLLYVTGRDDVVASP